MELPPLAVGRKRASTTDQDLKVPPPESHPKDYTSERLKQGVAYARARLSRNCTPRVEKLLTIYQAACEAAIVDLSDPKQGISKSNLDEIREYEIAISNKIWISQVPDTKQEHLEQCLLQLRRLTFWVRYGDYAMVLAREPRSKAAKNETQNWKYISGAHIWSEISSELHSEEKSWARYGSGRPALVPTTLAVYEACQHIGIGYQNMIQIIHVYADRNIAFYRGLTETIEGKNFNQVARWLDQDLQDLLSLVPIG